MRIIISVPGVSGRAIGRVSSEASAMQYAIEYAQGRSYRIEFYRDSDGIAFIGEPFKILEQAALPFDGVADV